jgi:hypothetical protein
MRSIGSIIAAGVFLSSLALCQGAEEDRFPDFSWDTVPRYMHVRKSTAFTKEEIQYLATFPLITFEKTTGMKDSGSTEKGTLKAAKAVKQINPRAKILYYRNILVHYPMYDADAALRSIRKAFLADQKGNTKLVRGTVQAYDLSNRAVQSWWLDNAKKVCSSEYINGLFVDGNIKVLEPDYLAGAVGATKKASVGQAYNEMMKKLPEMLGPEKLIVANIIRARFPRSGLEYMNYFDGSYIEGFEHATGGLSREEYMAKGISAVQAEARKGRIIAFTIGMGKDKGDAELGTDEVREQASSWDAVRQRFVYSLALYLICAEKYSYFMASDGYGVDSGSNLFWMKSIPEYSYPLGAPKGSAVKRGYTYIREFEHASVLIDVQKEQAEIIWEKTGDIKDEF